MIKDVIFEGTILNQIVKTVDFLETQVREHSFLGSNGLFVTNRNYPKFAIQELVVNSVCHRDYSIKGTEIQIKMFDDRLVVESPGRLPGLVRAENIRHTHFSRNPKIAEFLKNYNYVKEFGEGIDRICCELESRGAIIPSFQLDAFILKVKLMSEFNEKTQTKIVFGETLGETLGETEITERQLRIYNEIKRNVSHTAKSLARQLELSQRTVEREISFLRSNGFIDKSTKENKSKWVVLR